MMGSSMPPGIMWKTMSGTYVSLTPTLASEIFAAASAADILLFTTCQTMITIMLVSSTPATFDYLSGWPKGYGE
jgi:hypothetical protein